MHVERGQRASAGGRWKAMVSWPVCGVGTDGPGELHVGGEAVGDQEEPVAVAREAARPGRRSPEVGPGRAELWISRLPTFANSGHSRRDPGAEVRFGVGAGRLAVGRVRVDREARRQGHGRRLELARRRHRRAQLLRHAQIDVDARGRIGLPRGRLGVEARVEAELVAARALRPRSRRHAWFPRRRRGRRRLDSSGASQLVGFCRNGVSGLFDGRRVAAAAGFDRSSSGRRCSVRLPRRRSFAVRGSSRREVFGALRLIREAHRGSGPRAPPRGAV